MFLLDNQFTPIYPRWRENNMICSNCKTNKPENDFYIRRNRKKKLTSWCKSCLKEHRDKYAIQARIKGRCRTYNITEKNIKELYIKTKSRCQICGIAEEDTKKKSLCIDHNHLTGEIRGLLCDDCNVAIGRFKDNIEYIKNSIIYLQNN